MPSLSEVHVDQALTDFSVGLFQNLGGSVASRAFSRVNTAQQSNKYHVWTAADLHRLDAQKRAPNSESAGRRYGTETGSYFCDVWALHDDISEQTAANADAVFDLEQDTARALMDDLIATEDVQFASAAFATGVWGTDVVGTTDFVKWDDSSSIPIENIRAGIKTVLQNSGRKPNKLVLGYESWSDGLADHPDLLDRIKHTQGPAVVTESLVAQLLGLEAVIVASSVRNTAQEGLAASNSFNLGDNAVLIHAPDSVGRNTPTAGARFNWSGFLGASDGVRTKRFEIPEKDAFPRIETDMAFDHAIVTSALGYFFSDTTA
jgi:hypothetical protein